MSVFCPPSTPVVATDMLVYQGEERRRDRSPYVSEALRMQLAAIADRHKIDTIVLADSAGLLWAASHPTGGSSLAARVAQGLDPDRHAFVQVMPQPDPITARRLQVGPAELYLVARGSGYATRRSRRALIEATRGVRRILGSLIN